MIIPTHLLIANKIHDYITKNHGEVLNRRHFKYGNIKPDISRKNQPTKHTLRDSLEYVVSQIDKYKLQPNNISNHSIHIGMINHYLSDFFCSRHYYKYKHGFKGLFSHLRYEHKLHKTLKSQNQNGLLDMSDIENRSFFDGSLHDLIKDLEKEYKSLVPSIENDIIFALRAPLIVCEYLLRHNPISELVECFAT